VSDILWAAVISGIVVAILAPLLKSLIWDRTYRLTVDLESHDTKTDPVTQQFLDKEIKKLEFGSDEKEQMWGQSYVKTYIRLTIQNTSRKKIGGISLLMADIPAFWGWAQIDEGPPVKLTKDKISIGELQPHHKSVVQIWSSDRIGGWNLKKRFRISADEIDRVRMRFPMPEYLKMVYRQRLVNAMVYFWIVFTVGGLIVLFIAPRKP
jgi:hypothetical protein